MPSPKSETTLFVALPGHDPYAKLSRSQVESGIAAGSIRQSQLIWSPQENLWRPARDVLGIRPPVASVQPPVAKVAGGPRVAGAPRAVAAAGKPVARAATPIVQQPTRVQLSEKDRSLIKPDTTPKWLKMLCVGLCLAIVGSIILNWLLVTRPAQEEIANEYPNVSVYANMAAFVQPNHLILHLVKTEGLTEENLIPFLQRLSLGTRKTIFTSSPVTSVTLARGWSGDYRIDGIAWGNLGGKDANDPETKDWIVEHLFSTSGEPLFSGSNRTQTAQAKAKHDIWDGFVATLTK